MCQTLRSRQIGVESSNSVRRQKSKDTKSKNRVLKNTNAKSSTAHVRKMSRSVSIDSNKCETMNSTLCHANKSVLNTKTVNAVNDDSNIVCVSYGKDVFLLSHEKCVARYALSRNSNVKRALFATPVAAKSKNLGATSVVAKSRLSVANTPKATNKVIQLVLWIVDSGCSKHTTGNLQLLRNFVEKFMGTVCFGNDHLAAITGYGYYVQGNLTICHAEAIANACFTQIRSIVHTRYNKTPYAAIERTKTHYHISWFGSLCYPTNDRDDLGKMKLKADIEQVVTKPNSPVLNENADEFVQEDVADFDGNVFYNAPSTPTKNRPIEQVIGDPSKPIMIRNQLQTDAEVCMYALTVSVIKLKNIKEAMLDASWIESMQDELNQFKRLDVWELVECPIGRNIIAVKWIWKNKTDAENMVIRNKSRLVAKGYCQGEGINFEESFV
ncbi:retrovirus-related pol polyprotein from transposon TNT 1-94 [Tanacetum coccineum]